MADELRHALESIEHNPDWLKITAAAELKGVSPSAVRGWCKSGGVECVKAGRLWYVHRPSLLAFEPPSTGPKGPWQPEREGWLSVTVAARLKQVHPWTIREACRTGRLHCVRSGYAYEIDPQSLDAWTPGRRQKRGESDETE